MSSGFVSPVTIKYCINRIDNGDFLLPAIQRKFVWSSNQIEVLFDSIMREYPINSFMIWSVTDKRIKNNFRFYRFLSEYKEFFKEENPEIKTSGYKDFKAIIDGQQRLTSIYLGLKGSYAYKLPRKWLKDTPENMPVRHLYLDLSNRLEEDNERKMEFDFQFLTEYELKNSKPDKEWFRVSEILKFDNEDSLLDYISNRNWMTTQFTRNTLLRLWRVIWDKKTINYFEESGQEIEKVLDIFIRTNSGGEPLSFSDLLMSYTTANWDKIDARQEIPDVVKKVFEIGSPGFIISKDFVLKTCLVLFNESIKFQIRNFERSQVVLFEANWQRIKKCIIESFELFEQFGFNNDNLRAKNAVIPVIYFVFHHSLEDTINNPNNHKAVKNNIRKWLCISILKGVFGGQSDTVLSGIRRALKNSSKSIFPIDSIKTEFKGNASKNLSMDDDFIEELLNIRKDSNEAYPVLSLIYSHLDFGNQTFHKDHLHPAAFFRNLKREDCKSDEEFNYLKDETNWDTIPNLQLLNGLLNQAKQDEPLEEWVKRNNVDLKNQLIDGLSFDIKNFREFISARRAFLKSRIKSII